MAAASVGLLAFGAAVSGQTAEVHLGDDSLLAANSPTPTRHLPILFVHGHNPDPDEATNPNYRKNWQDPLSSLPSFKQALGLPQNSGLDIEEYYIRFLDQDRSITDDARDIRDAVNRILERHDSNFHHTDAASTTLVKVVIVAYSKGTISARLYLKSLQGLVPDIDPPLQPNFHPISEFIAISPPNHGINVAGLGAFSSTAVQQLLNGFGATSCLPVFPAATRNFIENLNGHPIGDTLTLDATDVFSSEAPGSRADRDPATGAPNSPNNGTLYVTIFADGNRDLVGGDTVPPNNDCQGQGRRLAKNLSADAVNIPLASITGNNAVAVHQNTVHTPEVICQALYAAVHHRSPVCKTCTLAGGVPVIPPPGRAAAMLTLDFSGSMSAPACPGCATRASVLKDAVELFTQLWSAVSVPSDRLGVTYFRTNVTPFPINGELLPLLSDGADDVIADVQAQTPGNSTAMGGGLQRAIEALGASVDVDVRRVILFTDGMQNVNPMVVPVAGHHEIINQAGHPNSNVTPTNLRLDRLCDIAVDTIGIGAGEDFVGLLDDIATETGGRTWLTTAPDDDLRQFFTEQLINALRGFSPQLVAYRHGSIGGAGSIETFAIEGGVHRVVLMVNWKRGPTIDFTVNKDGVDVTSAGQFIDGAFYKIFVIDLPAKGPIAARGNWQVRIKGKAATAYQTAAIVDGGPITYDAKFDAKRPRVGHPLDLVVRFAAGGKPISARAKVTVTLKSPTTAAGHIVATTQPKELPALETGMTVAERRLLSLVQDPKGWAALKPKQQRLELRPTVKGEFRTRFRPRIPGIYTAFVTIEGDAAKIGSFSRTLTVTAVVRLKAAKP